MFADVCRGSNTPPTQASALGLGSERWIDAVSEIKRLQIDSGVMKGAFLVAPAGCVNWYFSNLGLLGIVDDLSLTDLRQYLEPYLNLYLQRLNCDFTIDDVVFETGACDSPCLQHADSDDSYAATFLSLACTYLERSNNHAWWNTHSQVLRDIAYYNLTTQLKPNGLSSVFQSSRAHANSAGYLMDNCEVYRGLRDFANTLARYNVADDAAYYHRFADQIAASMEAHLFDGLHQAFRPSDAHVCGALDFYPYASCQIFPQAFGVCELAPRFDVAWQYLQRLAPSWAACAHDDYPWAVIGYAAALRGHDDLARAQLRCVRDRFSSVATRPCVTINELGFYRRTQRLLQARGL